MLAFLPDWIDYCICLGSWKCNFTSKLREAKAGFTWASLGTWTRCNFFSSLHAAFSLQSLRDVIYMIPFASDIMLVLETSSWLLWMCYFFWQTCLDINAIFLKLVPPYKNGRTNQEHHNLVNLCYCNSDREMKGILYWFHYL